MSRGGSSFTRAFFWPLQRLCSQTLLQAGFSYPPPGPSLFATALGKLRAKRVVARRPVRIWLVRSVCRIHDAIASHAAVVTSRTSLINFRLSNQLGVTLWPTCRRRHRQDQHSGDKPLTLSSLQTSEKTRAHGPYMFQGGRCLRGRHLDGFRLRLPKGVNRWI